MTIMCITISIKAEIFYAEIEMEKRVETLEKEGH